MDKRKRGRPKAPDPEQLLNDLKLPDDERQEIDGLVAVALSVYLQNQRAPLFSSLRARRGRPLGRIDANPFQSVDHRDLFDQAITRLAQRGLQRRAALRVVAWLICRQVPHESKHFQAFHSIEPKLVPESVRQFLKLARDQRIRLPLDQDTLAGMNAPTREDYENYEADVDDLIAYELLQAWANRLEQLTRYRPVNRPSRFDAI